MGKKISIFVAVLVLTSSLFCGKSEMLGPLTREQILNGNPDWQEVMAAYSPSPNAVQDLKTIKISVQVEVFLGTWCSDSKAHVSALFKVLDAIDTPLVTASFIGLPKDKEARKPYIEGRDIQRLPTFIVSVDGHEVGRIIESPSKSIEQDILDILAR